VEVYGVHTAPYEVGQIATRGGPMMAARDRYSVTIEGSGNLDVVTNAILQQIVALGTVTQAQAFLSQPWDVVFVQPSPTRVEAGRVTLDGTVSLASPEARSRVQQVILSGLGRSVPAGVQVRGSYEARFIAGVTNDATLAAQAAATVAATLGSGAMREVTAVVPAFSEDFGSFQERVPGVFFFLGVANSSRGWGGMPHSPDYVADERSIGIGARAMAAVVLDRLRAR
jgi:metal-dependent amidase/aminoacylase/carboxypeptidase family protein